MSTAPSATSTLSADRVTLDRRVPPLGGFNLTYLGIELKRRLRNRRTLFFTIAFPVVMYVIIGLRLRDEQLTATPVADGGVSVASGLNGTEKVVVLAGAFLNPGDKVKPVVQKSSQ